MTQHLFTTDAYLQTFEATVTAHTETGVVLDQTAFYPGGGGQPNDVGTFTADGVEWVVGKVKRDGGQIVHLIDGDFPEIGRKITGQLDWDRRFQLMRTHTAMHILCGVIWRDYQASVTGGNMEPLNGRMDFEFETLQKEFVAEIEAAVNREVEAARPVQVRILPRAEAFAIPDLIRTKINLLPEGISEVRTVALEGLDLQADGGTHVNNTSEVGRIRLPKYKSKGRINKRFYLELDS